ncbi:MAG: L,D-transpeptidase [Pseudomonadota bacterium]
MKRLFMAVGLLVAFFAAPAMASSTTTGAQVSVKKATSSYAPKKDKAYWTRVWHQKQAAKKKRGTKRRSTKKRRSSSGRVVARVDLSSQRMRVYRGGRLLHTWKVSTGRSGYGTPTGTWRVHRMHKRYFSKKYHGAPMPYAMFYYRGFAIHGTNAISRLGRRASHGCVRLHPSHAAKLFAMVRRHGGTVKVTY